jgi:ankyrin repeat protein
MLKKLVTSLILVSALAHASPRDTDGLTPLHRAAGEGNTSLVSTLLDQGEDPFALDAKMGVSVLHKAVYSGNASTVELLLARGALVNLASPSNGNTPLHDALYFRSGKDLAVVRAILRFKPSLAIRNRAGFTPVESARLLKHDDLVRELEAYENARQSPDSRALMRAVQDGNLSAVAGLLATANRDMLKEKDEQGFTPLIWAAREGKNDIVKALLAAGANPNETDDWMIANAGHKASFWGRAVTLRLLIAAGLDLDAQGGYNGYTALHDAVSQSHVAAVHVLAAAGARADIPGHDGKTARDIALAQNNPEVRRILGI